MLLLIRMLLRLITSSFRSCISVLDESVTSHRVLLNDADVYRHLNNGRYLSVMDLGRLDLIIRFGVGRELLRRRWYPVVGSASIRFLRTIGLFQRYDIRTRLICWDEKWIFLEQRFERKGRLMAAAVVKGMFLGPEDKIPPQKIARLCGHDGPSPPMPEAIRLRVESEAMQTLAQLASSAANQSTAG